MRVAAVVPAAGRGQRLGPGSPKALREIGGVPILVHAVRALARARLVEAVVVAAPPADLATVRTLLDDHEVPAQVEVVAGGPSRLDSVRRAVAHLPEQIAIVLVHDAARPLVPVEMVDSVATAVRGGEDAVVPVLPVTDTIKMVDGDLVTATPDRALLRAVQTPQGFRRPLLEQALAAAGADGAEQATDDAGIVERLGTKVRTVPGHEEALKVTGPIDLLLAEAVLARRRAAGHR